MEFHATLVLGSSFRSWEVILGVAVHIKRFYHFCLGFSQSYAVAAGGHHFVLAGSCLFLVPRIINKTGDGDNRHGEGRGTEELFCPSFLW